MVVMILERVSPSLRGELTRWLIQPKSGVFVGRISARVRDLLWERVDRSLKGGAALLIHDSDTEQGFAIRTNGATRRLIQDFEGLLLPKSPHAR
ncbi:MAG TPA: type I-E CRISPR-associated endoribonuclease Cas2e [Sedimentisphaerales bacterium]|nr:type I-E CRISPR-associated endoribonuclease Cas2e [Sedimentisphaerales bacterium]